MTELDRSRQKAIAEIVRRWMGTEVLRRHLRKLLNWRFEPDLPPNVATLVDELDRTGPDAKRDDTQSQR
ncbi:hypothetical protein NKH19_22415 [Mesorhizobium sp. M1338]|uniref:hypothetical protein n=1 Tax=unclassified Mesorhizobium TaxID=325217 RepID=UPI0033368805